MRGYRAAEILTSIRIVQPPRLGGLRIESTIADDEAVAGAVFFSRCDLHCSELLRREAEERLARMGADRLKKSEILRMAEDGETIGFASDFAADPAPPRAGGVHLHSVGEAGCCEKLAIFRAVPRRVAPEAEAAAMTRRQLKRGITTCLPLRVAVTSSAAVRQQPQARVAGSVRDFICPETRRFP